MQKDRNILAQIIKSWAQDHTPAFVIAASEPGDEGISNTASYLSWVIKEEPDISLDLVTLVDRLEMYINNIRHKTFPDGMHCRKCKTFYQYAEANQSDGSLICYGCRSNPYT